jgi:hypothetical protein
MWMRMIDRILIEDLGFTTTTHDQCIYTKKVDGKTILMLRQVDDFMLGCIDESIARNIYGIIGTKIGFLRLKKKKILFRLNGLVLSKTIMVLTLSKPVYTSK